MYEKSRPALAALIALLVFPWSCPRVFGAQDTGIGELDDLPTTTYERFLPLAEAGDPEARHLLGYMHFYGEGTTLDYDRAHEWFHLAAEEGDVKSMRNLGLFHAHAVSRIPAKFYAPEEANLWFSLAAAESRNPEISPAAIAGFDRFLATDKPAMLRATPRRELGKAVYQSYCAGCHGFDGRSSYFPAPSFAFGESLDKSDSQLLTGIGRALNLWPHRVEGIPRPALEAALGYIRDELSGQPTRTRLSDNLLASAPVSTSTAQPQNRARLAQGEKIFLKFCGGCHGFNGIATYVNSPSFALGERLHKSDRELASSIRDGRGEMPSWEFLLGAPEIDALLAFVRSFEHAYRSGIGARLREQPDSYFRFTPKSLLGSGRINGLPAQD